MSMAQERRAEERVKMLMEEESGLRSKVQSIEARLAAEHSDALSRELELARKELGIAQAQTLMAMQSSSY